MTQYDVFNGDADGLCSLQQLRLDRPCSSSLVTGVKRDIHLLGRVSAASGDTLTVLDISFDKNRNDVSRLLEAGAKITYFDHHFAGDIPAHQHLEAHIHTAPDTCTSLLVNEYLKGAYQAWAIVGAFGDNMDQGAYYLADKLNLTEAQTKKLRQLGICLNYNGYGASIQDLFYPPDELFKKLQPFADPFAFLEESDVFSVLNEGYEQDLSKAGATMPLEVDEHLAVYLLPNEGWARRVSGVFGNSLARQAPQRAHAILTCRAEDGGYVVSVRAPLEKPDHADALCRQFPTGGGRKAAAGINHLPEDDLQKFIRAFRITYQSK